MDNNEHCKCDDVVIPISTVNNGTQPLMNIAASCDNNWEKWTNCQPLDTTSSINNKEVNLFSYDLYLFFKKYIKSTTQQLRMHNPNNLEEFNKDTEDEYLDRISNILHIRFEDVMDVFKTDKKIRMRILDYIDGSKIPNIDQIKISKIIGTNDLNCYKQFDVPSISNDKIKLISKLVSKGFNINEEIEDKKYDFIPIGINYANIIYTLINGKIDDGNIIYTLINGKIDDGNSDALTSNNNVETNLLLYKKVLSNICKVSGSSIYDNEHNIVFTDELLEELLVLGLDINYVNNKGKNLLDLLNDRYYELVISQMNVFFQPVLYNIMQYPSNTEKLIRNIIDIGGFIKIMKDNINDNTNYNSLTTVKNIYNKLVSDGASVEDIVNYLVDKLFMNITDILNPDSQNQNDDLSVDNIKKQIIGHFKFARKCFARSKRRFLGISDDIYNEVKLLSDILVNAGVSTDNINNEPNEKIIILLDICEIIAGYKIFRLDL